MLISLIGSLLIFINCMGFSAFAETSLPPGAVKGLPERLAALDDAGNHVNSATGEYFFHVEDMTFGETYTKNVQLINLREDASYHIWFRVEPLFKTGEIDLEKGCECRFFLDDSLFFKGDVNGKGNIDLTGRAFDCGNYDPGETHTLRCEIVWNDLSVNKHIDNGWRLVDKDGEHILVDPDGNGHIEGEIEFKWIFYAAVMEPYDTPPSIPGTPTATVSTPGDGDGDNSAPAGDESVPDTPDSTSDSYSPPADSSRSDGFFPPYTGFMMKDGKFWLISMGVIALMILVLLVLIKKKGKKK